jgi:hypothetical protein
MKPPIIAMVLVLAAGCTSKPPEPERASRTLESAIAACTATFHYDPKAPDLPERALAPGEREWRACARRAVLDDIVPDSSVPDLYRRLVADDEQMTEAIAAGTLTRSERTARLEASITKIRAAETQAAEERQRRQMEALKTQMDLQRQAQEIDRINANAAQLQRIMVPR